MRTLRDCCNKNKLMTSCLFILFSFLILAGQTNAAASKEILPAIIIVYDDGHIQDFTKAFPVHKNMNAPAVSAVNPDTLGNKGKLKLKHLYTMVHSGWEVSSHGLYHTHLGFNKVHNKPLKGFNIIEVENAHLLEKRYSYYLEDTKTNSKREQIEIEDVLIYDDKHYIKTKEPISYDYSDKAKVVLDKKSMHKESLESKEILSDIGFNVVSFVYPYNGYTDQSKDIVQKNYKFARAGKSEPGPFPESFINTFPIKCHKLKGVCFESDLLTDNDLDTLLKETVQTNGLLILYAHTNKPTFCLQRLENILRTAQQLDLNIITFKDLPSNICKKGPSKRRLSDGRAFQRDARASLCVTQPLSPEQPGFCQLDPES